MQNTLSDNFIQQQTALASLSTQVIQFLQIRIQTQQLYTKQLLKLNNRFPNIEAQPIQCRKVLQHLKTIHLEKYQQIMQFILQLKQDKNKFINIISKKTDQLHKAINQIKTNQINLKNIIEKTTNIYKKGQEKIKVLDQQFLLKELQTISINFKNKKIQDSLKILDEQLQLCDNLKIQYQSLKQEGQKIIKKIKKYQKIIIENSPSIEKDIVQFIKKFTIQQLSLIRSIQYDIDNMIKKSNIFNDTPQQILKYPKNHIVQTAKQLFKEQFKINDVFRNVKKDIAESSELTLKQNKNKNNHENQTTKKYQTILSIWNKQKNVRNLITKLGQNYPQFRQSTLAFFGHFRKTNIYKFPKQQFTQLLKLFNILLTKSYQQKNLYDMQELIIYGNCYLCQISENTTHSMMEQLQKQEYFKDIYFWRFLLFFSVWKSVLECLSIEDQKQMYFKNYVYAILVSNSLNLINCGIDKYITKNNIAKIGKACTLTQQQINDLLKFIQSYQKKIKKQ